MKRIEETKKIIQINKPIIRDKFRVKRIGLFGSLVRGEQKKGSDIDILVEFTKPVSFFTFLDLENYLEKKLNSKVDLVTKKALRPGIGTYILNEVVYV